MLHSGMYSIYLSLFSLNCLHCRVESSVHLGSTFDLRVKIHFGVTVSHSGYENYCYHWRS